MPGFFKIPGLDPRAYTFYSHIFKLIFIVPKNFTASLLRASAQQNLITAKTHWSSLIISLSCMLDSVSMQEAIKGQSVRIPKLICVFTGCKSDFKGFTLSPAYTVKLLKIRTPKTNCCNYPKTRTISFYYKVMGKKNTVGTANSWELSDQGLCCFQEQSDQGLHCL